MQTENVEELISSKYQIKLIQKVNDVLWKEFRSYEQVANYIYKWHEDNYEPNGFNNNFWGNFRIIEKGPRKINSIATLNNMSGSTLLKVAIDLGVDTPDFIRSTPFFTAECVTHSLKKCKLANVKIRRSRSA